MKWLVAGVVLLLAALAGCGTPEPRVPEWRGAANAALADYVKQRLEGHAVAAARALTLAQERMRDGGDLDGLHTVLLARCAMNVALLQPADCGEFDRRNTGARAEALAYHALLTGRLQDDQIAALPQRYRAFAAALGANASAAQAVGSISDPVSLVVAAGVASRSGQAGQAVFAVSSAAARERGWRAAHRAHEEARARALEAEGRAVDAKDARVRLEALYGVPLP